MGHCVTVAQFNAGMIVRMYSRVLTKAVCGVMIYQAAEEHWSVTH